jgi:hypothetical protein
MLTAEARIDTERPSRYLVQVCQHAAKIGGSHEHRRFSYAQGEAVGRSDLQVRAEWSETNGTLTFDSWGECALQATTDALVLRIEATDDANLRQIQDVLSADLARIGRREGLTLNWN